MKKKKPKLKPSKDIISAALQAANGSLSLGATKKDIIKTRKIGAYWHVFLAMGAHGKVLNIRFAIHETGWQVPEVTNLILEYGAKKKRLPWNYGVPASKWIELNIGPRHERGAILTALLKELPSHTVVRVDSHKECTSYVINFDAIGTMNLNLGENNELMLELRGTWSDRIPKSIRDEAGIWVPSNRYNVDKGYEAEKVWQEWRKFSAPIGDPELMEKALAWIHNAITAYGKERKKFYASRLNSIKATLKEIK